MLFRSETTTTTSAAAATLRATSPRAGQGATTPVESGNNASTAFTKPSGTGSIEVVTPNIVCYNGSARMAPNYILKINETSSTERLEKCNSCDDLVKVYNRSTNSWNMLRGKDVASWERVSDK